MEMLEHRAQIDGLTGLWNRAHFDRRLEAELSEKHRHNTPMALVMCDLDHFKKLNDTFGHPAGDAVLETFASLISQEIRANDIACRYGGEEFALILPRTEVAEAVGVCERIRKALSARTFRKYPDIQATVSLGVAGEPLDDSGEPGAWLEAADHALYSAKEHGRNRVHVYSRSGCTPGTGDAMRMAG
jgi:diguanylate cyclase (GGDEF)-like protein